MIKALFQKKSHLDQLKSAKNVNHFGISPHQILSTGNTKNIPHSSANTPISLSSTSKTAQATIASSTSIDHPSDEHPNITPQEKK